MRTLFFVLFALTFLKGNSQNYFLIHKGMTVKPILTDSVTKEVLSKGFFPVYKKDIDSLLPFLKKIKKLNKMGLNRETIDNTQFNSPSFQYEVSNVSHPYGDRYEIDLISNTDAGKFTFKLCSASLSNIENQTKIRRLYDYIKDSKLVIIN